VDILAGHVFRGRVADGGSLSLIATYQLPGTVGAIAPVEDDDGWLLSSGQGLCVPLIGRLPTPPRPGRPGRNSDEERGLRSARPLLGRHQKPTTTAPEAAHSTGSIATNKPS